MLTTTGLPRYAASSTRPLPPRRGRLKRSALTDPPAPPPLAVKAATATTAATAKAARPYRRRLRLAAAERAAAARPPRPPGRWLGPFTCRDTTVLSSEPDETAETH